MVKNNEEISAIFSAMNDLDPLMNNYLRVLKKKTCLIERNASRIFSIRRTLHQISYS